MATYNFTLTLTETSPGSGPYYSAYYTTASVYVPITPNPIVYLPSVGTSVNVVADLLTTSFKLEDYPGGPCDTCNTSSVTFVTPPTASILGFCYSAYNSGSSILSASYTGSTGEGGIIRTQTLEGGVTSNFCVMSGSSITFQTPLLITECGYSCQVDAVCLGCGAYNPPTEGYIIAQCTGSTKYNVTFNTTSSITIGTVVSGSVFSGCYYVSSSFTGSDAQFDFLSASLFNVYADCATCAYIPPPYKWYATRGFETAEMACIGQLNEQVVWSNSASIVNTETFMYTDPGLTIPFSSGDPFFYCYSRTGVIGDGSWTAGLTSYFAPGMVSNTLYCG